MPEPDAGAVWEPEAAAPAVVREAAHPPGHTACPRCHHSVDETVEGDWLACHACSWSGRVSWFSPVREEAAVGEAATPEDAVCVHHPGRRAEATCAGSGAYVCPLCAVKLNGQVFDTAYVEAGGRAELEKALQRELPRPDRQAIQYLAAAVFLSCVPVILPLAGLIYGFKHLRLRGRDPLYRTVARHGWVVVSLVGNSVILLAGLAWVAALSLGVFAG